MKHYIEITQDAFYAISPISSKAAAVADGEHARITFFEDKGCRLARMQSHLSGVVQYYIQDINA